VRTDNDVHLTLTQHNEAFAIQSRMETPLAQLFGRILSPETPLSEVPEHIQILHALATCEYPDYPCLEALMFLAEVVIPPVTQTVQ
jgi:hypothetical protein